MSLSPRTHTLGAYAVVAVLGLTTAGFPSQREAAAASALQCANVSVAAEATNRRQATARTVALRKWAQRATSRLGSQWSSWSRASQKSLACKARPTGAGLPNEGTGDWTCSVSAVPCRIVR